MTLRHLLPVLLLLALATVGTAASATDEDTATHDGFTAVLRVSGHGSCRLSKSDAQVRARLACRDGYRTQVRPCPQEDSPRCFWHAPTRGNGQGRSFLALAGRVHYFRA